MKHLLVAVCLLALCLPVSVSAQDLLRKEIEISEGSDFQIVPVGEDGLLLVYMSDEKAGAGKRNLVVTKYDTEFKEVSTKKIGIDKNETLNFFDQDKGSMYLFFSDKKGAHSVKNYSVIKYEVAQEKLSMFEGEPPLRTSAEIFNVVDGIVYFGGRTRPTTLIGQSTPRTCLSYTLCCIPFLFDFDEHPARPVLMNLDFDNKKVKIENLGVSGRGAVLDVQENEANGQTYVVVLEGEKKKPATLVLKSYKDGKAVDSRKLKTVGSRNLVQGKAAPVGDSDLMVVGTYKDTDVDFDVDEDDEIGNYSKGMFITYIADGKQEYIKYYDFTKFESLKDYFKPRTKRQKKKKKEGKWEPTFSSQLLFHDPVVAGDQIISVAELYHPEYIYMTDANGKTTKSFIGFSFSNALVAGFDNEGNKLWDFKFNMSYSLTYNLKEKVRVSMAGDKVVLGYVQDGKLTSAIVDNGELIGKTEFTQIDTGKKTDEVKRADDEDIAYWYDNYYVAFGEQKIKNKAARGKRKVFYFNKLSMQKQ